MALDRTWYNTLVDDDGSGMTGSVWDKADVDSLMDAIDVQLAYVAVYPWTDYTPSLVPGIGTWTAANIFARYTQSGIGGKTITVQWSIENSTFTAAVANPKIALPFAANYWNGNQAMAFPMFINGAYEIGYGLIIPGDQSYVSIGRTANQQFPATGGIYVRGQFIYQAY